MNQKPSSGININSDIKPVPTYVADMISSSVIERQVSEDAEVTEIGKRDTSFNSYTDLRNTLIEEAGRKDISFTWGKYNDLIDPKFKKKCRNADIEISRDPEHEESENEYYLNGCDAAQGMLAYGLRENENVITAREVISPNQDGEIYEAGNSKLISEGFMLQYGPEDTVEVGNYSFNRPEIIAYIIGEEEIGISGGPVEDLERILEDNMEKELYSAVNCLDSEQT